jgi:gamma-glutamyltranspeptidase/glutathione hydrolase
MSGQKYQILLVGLVLFSILDLLGCTSISPGNPDTKNHAQEFYGGVAADEPRAALEGQKILSAGGNAADAATAVYFTLAVTLPTKASLGGGGVCMIFDQKAEKIEAINFLNYTTSDSFANTSRPSTVPGNPMGIFSIHARYGSFQWARLVAVGEQLARFGTQASRTLVNDIIPLSAELAADPGSREIFFMQNGKMVNEGSLIRQLDLAASLSSLRLNGAAGFYRGRFARLFVKSSRDAGRPISLRDLAEYKPKWSEVLSQKFGFHEVNFMPPPSLGGLVSAKIFSMLGKNNLFEDAPDDERYHILAEIESQYFVDFSHWLRDNLSSTSSQLRQKKYMKNNIPTTSFVVADRYGSVVACSLTMNDNSGIGRMAMGTGIMLAAAPKGPAMLGPIIVRNKNSNNLIFAGVSSGGLAAPTALMNVFARTMMTGEDLNQAISAKRVHYSGASDITFYEPGLSEKAKFFLKDRGHHLQETPIIGLVNVVYCSGGLSSTTETCVVKSDPRGSGLASKLSK